MKLYNKCCCTIGSMSNQASAKSATHSGDTCGKTFGQLASLLRHVCERHFGALRRCANCEYSALVCRTLHWNLRGQHGPPKTACSLMNSSTQTDSTPGTEQATLLPDKLNVLRKFSIVNARLFPPWCKMRRSSV